MSPLEAVLVLLAGVAAGTINAVVGSGTLITFPTLVALGVPPVVANISNNLGLVPGGVAGAIGYRRELVGQGARLRRLAPASLVGGAVGAVLLLVLPPEAFEAVVPVLILTALVLVVLQPRLQRRMAAGRAARGEQEGHETRGRRVGAAAAALGTGVYGGYFGAAQGILLVSVLGLLVPEPLQRVNALKNVLVSLVNFVAAIFFLVLARDRIDWVVVALVAAGSTVGGYLGGRFGRRLPPAVLRAAIVVVSLVALARLLLP